MKKHEHEEEFFQAVKKILTAKGFTKEHPALDELVSSIHYDQRNAQRKVFWYKWPGLILLVAIPLISAFVSIAVASRDKQPISLWVSVLPEASVVLTILTIFDSAFKPAQRFRKACGIGVEIEMFKGHLLADLEQLSTEDELSKYVSKKRQEFSHFSMALIDLFLPETTRRGKSEK